MASRYVARSDSGGALRPDRHCCGMRIKGFRRDVRKPCPKRTTSQVDLARRTPCGVYERAVAGAVDRRFERTNNIFRRHRYPLPT